VVCGTYGIFVALNAFFFFFFFNSFKSSGCICISILVWHFGDRVGRVYVMSVWIVFGYVALYCFVIWKMENNNKKTLKKKKKKKLLCTFSHNQFICHITRLKTCAYCTTKGISS